MKKYDVIIVGASFAGLAVASKLKGNVLLIDRKEIGTNVTSACGTTVSLIKEVKCEKSILQTFIKSALHTKDNKIIIPLPEKYAKRCGDWRKKNKSCNIEITKHTIKGSKEK